MEEFSIEAKLISLAERVRKEGPKAVAEAALAETSRSIFSLQPDGRVLVGSGWRGSLDQIEDLLSDAACLAALSGESVKDGLNYNQLSKMIEIDKAPIHDDIATLALRIRGNSGRLLYRVVYEQVAGETQATERAIDLRSERDIEHALELRARQASRSYHPVREYLNGLPTWDGTPRLEDALDRIFQRPGYVRPLETSVVRRFLPMWMISAVARAMRPGCKADCALVIFGTTQGQGKSEFFARLVPDRSWYSCDDIQMSGDKDSYLVVHQKFVVELAELATLSRVEVEKVKSFMSRAQDTFRAPYARTSKPHDRGFVFGGTTNKPDMLRDVENRRFWVYECDPECQGDMNWLDANRDQLWAEALAEYRADTKWWPEKEVASAITAHNEDYRQAVDILEDEILAAASQLKPGFKEKDVAEVLFATHTLGGEVEGPTGPLPAPLPVSGFDREQRDLKTLYERIRRVLLARGWSRTGSRSKRIGGVVVRGFYRTKM